MKKILTATIAAAALLGTLSAEDFNVDTYSANAPIYYSDKTTAFSSYDGYIATFWFAADNNPANLAIVGAGVSMDYFAGEVYGLNAAERLEYKGFLDWSSSPTNPLNMPTTEVTFAIRIFYAPDLVALYNGNEESSISLTAQLPDLSFLTLADWEARWEAALLDDSKEVGDFQYRMTPNGTTPLQLSELPNFKDKTYYMSAASIPEPSTWLLLGAGAAFTVIMRRRKK